MVLSWSCAGHLSCNEWRVWRKGSNSGWSQTLSFLIYEICAYPVNLIWHFKKFLHVYIVCYKLNIFPLFKFLLNSSFSVVVIFTNLPENTQSPLTQLTFSPFCSGLRDLPSPPCEGDRNQRWSDFGSVVLFLFLSFSPFIFPFFLLLAPRSDGSEPPPPSLSFPTFRFTAHLSNLDLYGGDLLEALGGLSLHRPLSLLSARICLFSGRQDLLRPWMFSGHRVWGLLPVRHSIDPSFGVDPLKLFLKSPHHTRIAWHLLPWQNRFDSVVFLVGTTTPNLLLFRTLIVVVALVLF